MAHAPADVAARLAIVTGRLNRRIRAANDMLSYGSLSALATVQKYGPIRLADLAALEFISAPSTTRLVAELERRGLVTREVDPEDGRAFLIESTPAGEEAVVTARQRRSKLVADMMQNVKADDWSSIERALAIIEAAIEHDEVPPPVRR